MSSYKKRIHRSNKKNKELLDRYVLPTYARLPITLVHGEGVWVWDADGKKYLDFFSGLAVANLGHAPRAIQKVIADQASHLLHVSNVFYIQEQGELAQKLIQLSGLDKAFFCNSGTEAVEACIKLARYSSIKKFHQEDRTEIIVAHNSFHGRTLGALSATMQKKYQSGFGPLVDNFKGVPFNDIAAVEQAITPQTCALLLEPIQGEGGVNIPAKDYIPSLRKLCDEKGIFLILDEVQVGIGRTGRLFAYQHFGIKPDLLALSKALGSGVPIGASLVSSEIAQFVEPGIHASTFGGNPLSCRAGLETLSIISDKKFLARVRKSSQLFLKGLLKLKNKFPIIKEVRGLGLMVACELSQNVGKEIVTRCLEKGLLINTIQGKILRFVPPLIIGPKEIELALKILEEALL